MVLASSSSSPNKPTKSQTFTTAAVKNSSRFRLKHPTGRLLSSVRLSSSSVFCEIVFQLRGKEIVMSTCRNNGDCVVDSWGEWVERWGYVFSTTATIKSMIITAALTLTRVEITVLSLSYGFSLKKSSSSTLNDGEYFSASVETQVGFSLQAFCVAILK